MYRTVFHKNNKTSINVISPLQKPLPPCFKLLISKWKTDSAPKKHHHFPLVPSTLYLNYFPSLLLWLPLYNKNVVLSISLCYSRLAWNELLLPLKDLFLRANFHDPRAHLPRFMFSTVFVNNPSK